MIVIPSTVPPIRLMILLHGVGANGDNLRPLGEAFASALPGTTVAVPDAPEPHDGGGPGRQWFSVSGVTTENRPGRVTAARAGFDRLVREIVTAEGFDRRPSDVVFAGFSQGTIMALDAVANGRWTPGAVVGFSGRMATTDRVAGSSATRILLVHGTADPVIPPTESRSAAERLAADGFAVETEFVPGLGHAVDPAGFRRAVRFLAAPAVAAAPAEG